MFDWLKRKCPLQGAVYFRGNIPPTPENFARLSAAGVSVEEAAPHAGERWRLAFDHPQWGKATLTCPQEARRIPDSIVDTSWLSDADKVEIRLGQTALLVDMDALGENILRDRKYLLRYLHAASGGDGVAVFDFTAQRVWSRADLDDEMRHDADLDVEGLYTVHAITWDRDAGSGDGGETVWIHTHGLAELGLVDFDLVQPRAGAVIQQLSETMRVIAGNILEGNMSLESGPALIGHPDVVADLVDIKHFLKNARNHGVDVLRGMLVEDESDRDFDAAHIERHVVVCEPGTDGFLKNLFAMNRPSAIRFPWEERDGGMMYVSKAMTEVMAARARATYDVLRATAEEFRSFEFPVLAKLGYEVDDGDAGDREHMWFEVHGLQDGSIDATLLNEPFDISAMHEGDRARHPVDRFTDWAIYTPFGQINPRSFTAARMVRENPEAAKEAMDDSED